jgi:hypothetical protein
VHREGESQFVGEYFHSKSLPYGAFAMVVFYWAAKFPPVQSAVPHIGEITNSAAASFTAMVGWQLLGQAGAGLRHWCSRHVQFSIRGTFSWGKPPRERISHRSDSS